MVNRPSNSQTRQFRRLILSLEPGVRDAFIRAVDDLHANVNWPELISALESGSVGAAIASLNISEAAFISYSQAMAAAFVESGVEASKYIIRTKQAGIGLRFNMQNPRAEKWIRENVAGRVVGFAQEQVEIARTVIENGYAAGNHPRNIATDLVGRVNRSGTREGGVLGLDGPRAARLNAVSNGMRTAEGVQDLVVRRADGSLSVRYKVNPATHKRILSAYRKGEAVPLDQRILSERQYSNALLKHRADTVADTEVAGAVMGSRDEAWQQAAESQGMDRNAIRKTWRHRRGPQDGRETHIDINGTSVMGLDTPFILSDGSVMNFPHDPNGGARNNIRCSCDAEYSLRRVVI